MGVNYELFGLIKVLDGQVWWLMCVCVCVCVCV